MDYSGTPYLRFILDYQKQIDRAKKLGLKLSIHTAEIPEQQTQETKAILGLNPSRLGHFNYFTDEELDQVHKQNILVEVCPTSNLITKELKGLEEHHLVKFVEKGIPISICTDDVLLFRKSLSEEIHSVTETFGYGVDFLEKISKDAVNYAFVKEQTIKDNLSKKIQNFYEGL